MSGRPAAWQGSSLSDVAKSATVWLNASQAWKWKVEADREASVRGKSSQKFPARRDSPIGIVVIRERAPFRMGKRDHRMRERIGEHNHQLVASCDFERDVSGSMA